MTQNEIKLAVEALYWYNAFKDVCPDVGMGPLLETLLERIGDCAGVEIDEDAVLAEYNARYRKKK